MNFFDVKVEKGFLVGAKFRTKLTDAERETLKGYEGKTIVLGIRPENMAEGGDIPVKVFSNENLGMNTLVHGHIDGSKAASDKITAKLRGWCDYKEGDTVMLSVTRKHFFDKETTQAIGREAKA